MPPFTSSVTLQPRTSDCILFPPWLPHRVGEQSRAERPLSVHGLSKVAGAKPVDHVSFMCMCKDSAMENEDSSIENDDLGDSRAMM